MQPFYDMAKMCTDVLKVYQDMLLQALRGKLMQMFTWKVAVVVLLALI